MGDRCGGHEGPGTDFYANAKIPATVSGIMGLIRNSYTYDNGATNTGFLRGPQSPEGFATFLFRSPLHGQLIPVEHTDKPWPAQHAPFGFKGAFLRVTFPILCKWCYHEYAHKRLACDSPFFSPEETARLAANAAVE
jgi:hypothetical protein